MEGETRRAFSITAAALRTQSAPPRWRLNPGDLTLHCVEGALEFDLGAIGKGFALDRMGEELMEWDCPSFLLVAGGSSTLAGDAPPGAQGWSAGLGDNAGYRLALSHCSLSGSGLAVKGSHILDPRTGNPAQIRNRAWAIAGSAAVSDALSTACMVLDPLEIVDLAAGKSDWLVALNEQEQWLFHGSRAIPPKI
jgi:thiamine biosynthesis lipoprotein